MSHTAYEALAASPSSTAKRRPRRSREKRRCRATLPFTLLPGGCATASTDARLDTRFRSASDPVLGLGMLFAASRSRHERPAQEGRQWLRRFRAQCGYAPRPHEATQHDRAQARRARRRRREGHAAHDNHGPGLLPPRHGVPAPPAARWMHTQRSAALNSFKCEMAEVTTAGQRVCGSWQQEGRTLNVDAVHRASKMHRDCAIELALSAVECDSLRRTVRLGVGCGMTFRRTCSVNERSRFCKNRALASRSDGELTRLSLRHRRARLEISLAFWRPRRRPQRKLASRAWHSITAEQVRNYGAGSSSGSLVCSRPELVDLRRPVPIATTSHHARTRGGRRR